MGVGATYDVHLRLIGKLVGDFLLVIIELFFARCFRFVTITSMTDGRTDGQTAQRSERPRCIQCSAEINDVSVLKAAVTHENIGRMSKNVQHSVNFPFHVLAQLDQLIA